MDVQAMKRRDEVSAMTAQRETAVVAITIVGHGLWVAVWVCLYVLLETGNPLLATVAGWLVSLLVATVLTTHRRWRRVGRDLIALGMVELIAMFLFAVTVVVPSWS